ncbi:MAG: hypothetical protein NVSMB20_22770 [Bradyrhizobium sp.]
MRTQRYRTPNVPFRQMAALYRTNAQSRALEEALRREQWEARAAGLERQQHAVAANGAGRSLRSAVPERTGHAMRPTPVAACIVCRLLV